MIGLGVAGFVGPRGRVVRGLTRGGPAGMRASVSASGASRSTDTDALRFDLARRFGNDAQGAGWVLTVGKGFVFSPLGRRPL